MAGKKKIEFEYSENMNIEKQIEKIIEEVIKENNYEYEIVFIDNEGNELNNFKELESYELLSKNLKNLTDKIKKSNNEFKEITNSLQNVFNENQNKSKDKNDKDLQFKKEQ